MCALAWNNRVKNRNHNHLVRSILHKYLFKLKILRFKTSVLDGPSIFFAKQTKQSCHLNSGSEGKYIPHHLYTLTGNPYFLGIPCNT